MPQISVSVPAIVIDTNVLIATINRRNEEFFIYESFIAKRFDWIVSTEILDEYAEKLTDFYSQATANYVLDILCTATNVIFLEPYYRWNLIHADVEDNKFADLALSANAQGLITFDKHFDSKSCRFPGYEYSTLPNFGSISIGKIRPVNSCASPALLCPERSRT